MDIRILVLATIPNKPPLLPSLRSDTMKATFTLPDSTVTIEGTVEEVKRLLDFYSSLRPMQEDTLTEIETDDIEQTGHA